MEQKQEENREHNDKLKRGASYIVLFIMVTIVFVLCAQICTLEKNIDSLQSQIEEIEFALELVQERESDETVVVEPTPVPVQEVQASVSGNASVSQDISVEEDTSVSKDVSEEEVEEAKHKVYLTFDDGPSEYTEAILDILDSYNVKATFFVLGKEDELSKERLKMIYDRGHTIGMHSYSHVYSEIYSSMESFEADFWKMRQYIFETLGSDCMYYRFPGGSSNTVSGVNMQECVDFLAEQGVEYYDWNIISGDGSSRRLSKETIIENSTATIPNYETSIVLMHDSANKKETVEALPEIIETILAMEDTVILPITEETNAIHHAIK